MIDVEVLKERGQARLRCAYAALGIVLPLSTLGFHAHAGPDDTTQALMDEPISLLDWGIHMLDHLLQDNPATPSSQALYQWDQNRILISSISAAPLGGRSADEARSLCQEWFSSIRQEALVNPETGRPWLGEISYFADVFRHEGYSTTRNEESTNDVLADLDRKFFLQYQVNLTPYGEDSFSSVTCSAPLLSSGFAVQVDD